MPEREDGQDLPGPGGPPARQRTVFAVLTAIVLLALGFVAFSGFWTDRLWFDSLGYGSVFRTGLWTRVRLFAGFGTVTAAAVGVNCRIAHRLRPPHAASYPDEEGPGHYREGIAPFRGWLLFAVCGLVGLISGASAAGQWRLWLGFADAVPFGTRDPQFGLDAAFYVFDLPWYRYLLSFGFAVTVLSLLAATLTHYLYGGLRVTPSGARASAAASGHLAVLLGLFVSLKAVSYWLDRYGPVVRTGGFGRIGGWTGLRYTDAHVVLPAKTALCCIAVVCALLFFAAPWRRDWRLPALALALLGLSAVIVGGICPAIVQKYRVGNDPVAMEAPYLARNIAATRRAFGIDHVGVTRLPSAPGVSAPRLRADAGRTADVTLLDPATAAAAFRQTRTTHGRYTFAGAPALDRYPVAGRERPTVLGLRELRPAGIPEKGWSAEHRTYTHGYGLAAAAADATTGSGAPLLTDGGAPSRGALGPYEPRIYYGLGSAPYAIVGGAHGDDGGPGGVRLDGPLVRAAYAVRTGDPQVLFSDTVGADSRIVYDRSPRQRVQAVAPWLTLDGTPYPAVVGKHVLWIVDGYTTSDDYPYATRTALPGGEQVNYVRDAVKATVDAYDGSVRLYQWDTRDPILRTWMRAFPHTVLPRADVPRALLPHLRYPPDLFGVQRDLLAGYHVTSAADFARGSGGWRVGPGPAGTSDAAQYRDVTLPGGGGRSWRLTSVLSDGHGGLGALVTAGSDATAPGYGVLRLLEPAAGDPQPGPAAVQSRFTSDPATAKRLAALRGGGARVDLGELQAVPLDGGVLYVEPVYRDVPGRAPPALKLVMASWGPGKPACGATLGKALDALFAPAGARAPAADRPPPSAGARARGALADAQRAYDAGRRALRAHDRAAYDRAQKALGDALRRAADAEK